MKKKFQYKCISLFMAIILLLTLPTNVQAVQSRSDPYFLSYGIALSSIDGLYMTFSVTAKQKVEMIGVSFFRVQRRVNGNWSNVTDYVEGHLCMNDITCQMTRIYTEAVSGVQYRVYARLYIRDYDGTVSTIDYYSQSYTLE